MKRVGYLYEKICTVENIRLAERKARLGKTGTRGVKLFDRNAKENILKLHQTLASETYRTSPYKVFTVKEEKEREIFRLPYYPDRLVHHAIMNVLEPIFVSSFNSNTYSCIKKRGIHKCARDLKRALQDVPGTTYCLKLDVEKFYPSINHEILKALLSRKFKDPKLMRLLNEIIESPGDKGVPIGNYLSQFLANFYLSGFDHWVKETKKINYYFRYCDDIVILGNSKQQLRDLLSEVQNYMKDKLDLSVKPNHQIFPVEKRGIDFVGYRFYHTHILLRKRIKKRFVRMIKYNKNRKSIASYNGWLKHCNSVNLQRRYLT